MASCFLLHQENDSAFYLVCGFVKTFFIVLLDEGQWHLEKDV